MSHTPAPSSDKHNAHNSHEEHKDAHHEVNHNTHQETKTEKEEKKKEYKAMNDVIKIPKKDLKEVDVGKLFRIAPLKPFKPIYKKNTLDIQKETWKKINLSLFPIIKILQLQKPIQDIIKHKKNNDIILLNPPTWKDKNTLDITNIENIYTPWPVYFDFKIKKIKPSKTMKQYLIEFKMRYFKKLNWKKDQKKDIIVEESLQEEKKTPIFIIKYRKKIFISMVLLWCIFWYGVFTKYMVENTFKSIQNIPLNTDVEYMENQFIRMKSDVILTNFLLQPIFIINYIAKNETLYNIQYTLNWMKNLINYAISTMVMYNWVQNIIHQKWPGEVMYSELFRNLEPTLLQSKRSINQSLNDFSRIKNLWDPNLNRLLWEKIAFIKKLNFYTDLLYNNKEVIQSMLWDEVKRTYIIVFQNSDEIRPTGWFMGSVGFIQIYKWKILYFEKKDIYAIEWLLKGHFKEKAPEWLSFITETFGLRDANYFLDIAESSKKIKYFLDQTNYKIDGIVYINQNIILDFLKNVWWIYFAPIKKDITSDNFSMIMSTLVESKITKTHTLATPKQILFDFIDLYIEKLKNEKKYSVYMKNILESVEKKDLILYSFQEKENTFLSQLWLIQKDLSSQYLDFNYPVFTSISWNKSDRYMQRTFIKDIQKNPDCSILSSLEITLTHTFKIAEEINIKNFLYDMDLLWKVNIQDTLTIQWKALNKQYIRVLLPKDALLEENSQMKIKDIWEKKEVSFYMNTNILFPTHFTLLYTLPNKECKPYSFLFQKQPWIKKYTLKFSQNKTLIWENDFDKDYIFK